MAFDTTPNSPFNPFAPAAGVDCGTKVNLVRPTNFNNQGGGPVIVLAPSPTSIQTPPKSFGVPTG